MPSPAFEPGFTPASASLEAFANTFARIVSSATNLPAAQQTDFSSYICTFDTPPAQFQSAAGRKRKLDVFLENSQPHGPPNHLLDDYSYVFDVPDSTFITLTQPWLGHKRSFPSAGSVFNQGIFSDDEANKWMTCTRTQNQDSTDESGAFPVYDPSPFFPDPFFSYV
ncbi:hypothetical protein DL96DRAFT_1608053 [Flagelloscypha sp. PMI_526]|nr:hypothetical protein DL96DRAFT_1608053 [Flagelloscypha sp. PMI_526]